jgi:hypothetical protein
LSTFFGRRSGIYHLLDRVCGQLLSALPPAGLGDRFRWRRDLQPGFPSPGSSSGALVVYTGANAS